MSKCKDLRCASTLNSYLFHLPSSISHHPSHILPFTVSRCILVVYKHGEGFFNIENAFVIPENKPRHRHSSHRFGGNFLLFSDRLY